MTKLTPPEEPQQDENTDIEVPVDDYFEAHRSRLRISLNNIASEVAVALKDAQFAFEVFFTVPSVGEALMNFGTLVDPTDHDWDLVTEIICAIVGRKIGIQGLRCRHLPCAS